MFKTKEEIKKWLDTHNITNYTINDDLTIDVNRSVNISYKHLTEIPVSFNKVNGSFWCSSNSLTSLVGCPKKVNGNFECYNNQLTSLKGCPDKIDGHFRCDAHLKDTKEYKIYMINKRLSELV